MLPVCSSSQQRECLQGELKGHVTAESRSAADVSACRATVCFGHSGALQAVAVMLSDA